MMSTLETGYFIWNFSAWIRIFLLSAGIFSVLTYLIWRRSGGSLVRSMPLPSRGRQDGKKISFEERVAGLRSAMLGPWFELPYLHLLSLTILFLLFAAALFTKVGAE